MGEENPVKVLVVGNSGVGKSFLANVLLGHESFAHSTSVRSVTSRVEWEHSHAEDSDATDLEVFNIPGLIEADPANVERNKQCIRQAFETHSNYRSVVLFVFGASKGGRVVAEDVSGWEAIKGFLQPEARRFNVAIAFVVNQVPIIDSDDERADYQAEMVRTLADMCGATSFSGRTYFVDQIPRKRTREDYSAPEMKLVRGTLLSALRALLPRALPIVPERDAVIELERDRLKREIQEISHHLSEVEQRHSEEMKARTEEHLRALAQVKEENERRLREMRESSERQLAAINAELQRNQRLLEENREALERAHRENKTDGLAGILPMFQQRVAFRAHRYCVTPEPIQQLPSVHTSAAQITRGSSESASNGSAQCTADGFIVFRA
eukprot:m51a1_g14561 hypothetical protein (383) ;mRNA; f:1031694-1035491